MLGRRPNKRRRRRTRGNKDVIGYQEETNQQDKSYRRRAVAAVGKAK